MFSSDKANMCPKVLEYLSKKGYSKSEAALRTESAVQEAEGDHYSRDPKNLQLPNMALLSVSKIDVPWLGRLIRPVLQRWCGRISRRLPWIFTKYGQPTKPL